MKVGLLLFCLESTAARTGDTLDNGCHQSAYLALQVSWRFAIVGDIIPPCDIIADVRYLMQHGVKELIPRCGAAYDRDTVSQITAGVGYTLIHFMREHLIHRRELK